MNSIYILVDPITNKIRYVGRTKHINVRYNSHIRKEHVNQEKDAWIDSLKLLDKVPEMKILEENVHDNIVKKREKYWIIKYKSSDLLNIYENTYFSNNKGGFQLTSIKINPEIYKDFKIKCIDVGFTLQKLVNISIYLYNENEQYKNLIHETISAKSGSVKEQNWSQKYD